MMERLRGDSFPTALESVPYDDELLTPGDIEAIERGRADYAEERYKSLEEVKREYLGASARQSRDDLPGEADPGAVADQLTARHGHQ